MANKLNGKAFALNSIDPVKLSLRSDVGDFVVFDASGLLTPHVGMNINGNVVQFNQKLIISGDLTVQGGTVSVDSTDTSIADGMVVINSNATSGSVDGGIEVARGDGNTSSKLYFSESTEDKFALKKGEDATEYIIANLEDATAADIVLNSSLTGETARAIGIESDLTQDVNNESSTRGDNDDTLTSMLSTQLSNFTDSLVTHNGNINSHIEYSSAAEIVLSGSVDTEISREQGAISSLTSSLDGEDDRQNGAMSSLEESLADEITREGEAIAALQAKLNSEVSREQEEISNLTGDLEAENTAATTKEAEIQAEIDSLNAAITAEISRATEATTALTEKFDAAFDKFGVGGTYDPSNVNDKLQYLLSDSPGTLVGEHAQKLQDDLASEGWYETTSVEYSLDSLGQYKAVLEDIQTFNFRELSNRFEGQHGHTCKVEYTYDGETISEGEVVISNPDNVDLAGYTGYGDLAVSCNGLQLPDNAVTFTITPGVKSTLNNQEHLWVTMPQITEVKILVDEIHYEIEDGDFFIIQYDKAEGHTDKTGLWNEHDETPYCCDEEGTNYRAGATTCDNTLCTYPGSCDDTSVVFVLQDSWGDGGQLALLYEADGSTPKNWVDQGDNSLDSDVPAWTELIDTICAVPGTAYVIALSGDYYSHSEGGYEFQNADGESLTMNGIQMVWVTNQTVKYTIVLESDGSITISPFEE